MNKKYLLIAGEVRSREDGQIHHVDVKQLARLYRVRLAECQVYDPRTPEHWYDKHLIRLRPDSTGVYEMPKSAPRSTVFRAIAAVTIMAASMSACSINQYAVKPEEQQGTTISLSGKKLVTISAKGSWTWHHKPEEVVVALVGLIDDQTKTIEALTKKVAAIPPAAAVVASSTTAKVK